MPEKNEIETLQLLIAAAQQPKIVSDGGAPFVFTPPGHQLISVESFLQLPTRKRGFPTFTRAQSFTEYVNEQKTADSRLYVTGPTQLQAILNHHGADKPGWKDHVAMFNLTQTPEWVLWKSKNMQAMSQRDFAQFIEDNRDDIAKPTGAELLDMIRTVRASQNLEITGEIDEKGDTKAQGFVVAMKTKTGTKQELELPSEFELRIAPYEGDASIIVKARLRLELCAPRLTLRYELVRVQQTERESLENIVASVADEIEMEAWYGSPS